MHVKPFVLIILDGWGYREETSDNAIAQANTPNWRHLWNTYPHTLVSASGEDVGLPKGQMGNSEVGHLHLGAGRLLPQSLTKFDRLIQENILQNHPLFLENFHYLKVTQKTLHILGLLSPGGVHSHEDHLLAVIEAAAHQGVSHIQLHAFLDGRDTPPRSALSSLQKAERLFNRLGKGQIASLCGRYYAMDRDKRWQRTEKAYTLLTTGQGEFYASSAQAGLEAAYLRQEGDEFIQPTWIQGSKAIVDGDVVIFMNFRADRARQLSQAFMVPTFSHFPLTHRPSLHQFITLTEYSPDLGALVTYPTEVPSHTLGQLFSEQGLTQLRIAETEKYAHVTYFFNGGVEDPFPREERCLVPSPKVKTYDLAPAMSAAEMTDKLIAAILTQRVDFIVCNFANPDMVGHTGLLAPTKQAIEFVDECLGRIIQALLQVGGEAFITADHGNAECMTASSTGQPHTSHTTSLVPWIYVGRPARFTTPIAKLYDVAPTLLTALHLPIPSEMTGKNCLDWISRAS